MSKGWATIALFIAAIPSAPAAEPELPKIRVGLLEGMFRDVPRPIMTAMAEPFRNMMFKQTGLTGDVELCSTSKSLAEKLKDRSVTVGVFHGFEYAWAKHANANLVPLLVTVPHGRKVQAMIVVSADSEIKKTTDLKGVAIVIPKGLKAHAQLYLDKIRSQVPTIETAANPATLTPEEALNAVMAGREKAVITDISTLNGYYGLQPGAVAKLKNLAESEMFPCAVIATEKGTMTEENMERIRKGLAGASKTAQGRAMLMLWAIKGFENVPEDYEDQCKKIMIHYPPSKLKDTAISVDVMK